MKILISGAGIAGLALAHCLHRKGHRSIVVEKAPHLRDHGYLLGLVGAGYDVAERTDLLPSLAAVRHTPERMVYLDPRGAEKFAIDGGAIRRLEGPRTLNLMRGDIERCLYAKVADAVDLRFATTIRSIEQDGARARVTLDDGSMEACDLVVGADGLHSRVRALLFGDEEPFIRFLGCRVAAYVLDRAVMPDLPANTTHTLTEPNRSVSIVTTGDDRLVVFFIHRAERKQRFDTVEAELRTAFAGMDWRVPSLLDRVGDASEIYFDEVSQVEMPTWRAGRVALLGDAGYAVSLIAGQGASMAMTGAYILAEELDATPGDVPGALGRYETRMRARITPIQKAGRRNVGLFVPSSRFRIALRDLSVRLACSPLAAPVASLSRKVFTPGRPLSDGDR